MGCYGSVFAPEIEILNVPCILFMMRHCIMAREQRVYHHRQITSKLTGRLCIGKYAEFFLQQFSRVGRCSPGREVPDSSTHATVLLIILEASDCIGCYAMQTYRATIVSLVMLSVAFSLQHCFAMRNNDSLLFSTSFHSIEPNTEC